MATLLTKPGAPTVQQTLSSPCLRTWLGNDWAILFSHPDDFVSYDLEMDRWLVIVRRAFSERCVRPIALASPTGGLDRSWVTQVSDDLAVLLEDATQHHFGPVDLQIPVLREKIDHALPRFVTIIDAALRIQKMFTYESLSNLPSPLELLGWADALRTRQAERHQQVTERQISRRAAIIQAHPFLAARGHRHPVPQVACAPSLHARAV